MQLNFAYSPCPNDTYTYFGIMSGKIVLEDHKIEIHHHDIETLNKHAIAGTYEITKMSFFTWLKLKDKYGLLRAGNSLGFGCGPILISKKKEIKASDLPFLRIVLPGELTTANLLFSLYSPRSKHKSYVQYDQIFNEMNSRRADCGVVIHESRFLYEKEGFYKVCDLGVWWEETAKVPIPLGAVGIRSDLLKELDGKIEGLIKQSLDLSKSSPQIAMPYIKKMAIEMEDQVIDRHIKTFVNSFTYDLGDKGMEAINKLEEMARSAGIIQ
ncbi:1,4-dihydroxy-6-naphthoate synthase [Candidatus Saganbacteria bacterium]|nr:1,4-dihydroxy-6-naphthoate synthase [Candidatus Saganbacteria bacterium]